MDVSSAASRAPRSRQGSRRGSERGGRATEPRPTTQPAHDGNRAETAVIGARTTFLASPRHSALPPLVLGIIAVALGWGLYASGLGADILGYRKDIVYLVKQHLMLVGISGSLAIVSGVGLGVWLSRPSMARHAEGVIQAVN